MHSIYFINAVCLSSFGIVPNKMLINFTTKLVITTTYRYLWRLKLITGIKYCYGNNFANLNIMNDWLANY
jgi:hypothetical protein